jgi:anti-sigma-K factor RskA
MSDRCPQADTVASYLLGALDVDERAQFESHLSECVACRDDVAALSPVVDALPVTAPSVTPTPALRARIMDTVGREAELLRAAGPEADRPRRTPARRAWWSRPAALAGAVASLGVAVVAGFGIGSATNGTTKTKTVVQVRTRTVQAQVTGSNGAAFVVLRSGGVATLRVKGLPAPPRGYVYEVWLLRRGATAPSPTDALFSVNHQGSGRVALPSVSGVQDVLVTAEPDGGSPAPTSKPVISAPL